MFMWFFKNNSKIILRCDKKSQTFSSHVGIFHNVKCLLLRFLHYSVTGKVFVYIMASQRDQSIVTSYALSRLCANEYIRMCGFTRVNLLENDFPEIHTKREK